MPTSQWGPDPRIVQGGRALGELLSGRGSDSLAYEKGLRAGYDMEYALQRAGRERGRRITEHSQHLSRSSITPELMGQVALGDSDAQAQLMAYTLSAAQTPNIRNLGDYARPHYGANVNAAQAALGDGDIAGYNQYTAASQGDAYQPVRVLGDAFVPDGMTMDAIHAVPTPVGLSRIEANEALAGQRSAAANLSNVRAAGGGFAPGSSSSRGAGGNQVFTFFEDGRQTTAVSPDGTHYFTPDGGLVPLPAAAVPLSGARAVDELTRDNIRTGLDQSLGELGASMPAPESDPYAQAVEEISGPLASTVGRAATFVTGLGGDGIRQPQREAETFVDNVNQMVKRTLVNNPRFPQFEQRIVERLLPSSGLSAGQQVTRANELRRVLNNQIEQKRADLGTADPVEARRINGDIRQLTEIVTYMNRGPASTRSGVQLPALGESAPPRVRVPVSRGAPPPTSAPAPRARNPETGEVVELRNGQWVPVP